MRNAEGSDVAELGDLIVRHAEDIAAVLSRDEKRISDLFNVLAYSLREMIRNVFEHSGTNTVFYRAQYWPKRNAVEVCLLDRGIGIKESLSANPNFRFKANKQAVEMSLWPGVSGRTHLRQNTGNWANSEFGLYMISRLARHGGNFTIASGDACIVLSKTLKKENFATRLHGTAIRVDFDASEIGNVTDRLAQFRKEAPNISKQFAGLRAHGPSYMSMVLRRDFRETGLR